VHQLEAGAVENGRRTFRRQEFIYRDKGINGKIETYLFLFALDPWSLIERGQVEDRGGGNQSIFLFANLVWIVDCSMAGFFVAAPSTQA
jgi:hypothetical protein